MTNELNNIFKQLIQQCNIEAISTKDLAATLTKLYSDVENLSKKVEQREKEYDQEYKRRLDVERDLEKYKFEFVEPKQKFIEASAKLERQQWEFELEKKYILREVSIYKEIVASTTSVLRANDYYNNGQGGYHDKNQFVEKPYLPNPELGVKK